MNIQIQFEGLEELLKAFERAASDGEIREVNRKIVDKVKPEAKNVMARKIPRSNDLLLSGRWFGVKSHVSAHAADSVPVEATKNRGTSASAEVGWTLKDHSDYFYMKFKNWGAQATTKPGRSPIVHEGMHFVEDTAEYAEEKLRRTAEQEYQAFLNDTIGR